MSNEIEKFHPGLTAATSAIGSAGTALRASKLGQTLGKVGTEGKKLAEGVKEVKESPMAQAFSSLKDSADRNATATQQMTAEARELSRVGAGTGSTTMGN